MDAGPKITGITIKGFHAKAYYNNKLI